MNKTKRSHEEETNKNNITFSFLCPSFFDEKMTEKQKNLTEIMGMKENDGHEINRDQAYRPPRATLV